MDDKGFVCREEELGGYTLVPLEGPLNIDQQGPLGTGLARRTKLVRLYKLLNFKNGFYQHQVFDHLEDFTRKNGDPLKYSSWVIEAANAEWKDIIENFVTTGGRVQGDSDAYHPARQALQRFQRLVRPEVAAHHQKHVRWRKPKRCPHCDEPMLSKHWRECTERPEHPVVRNTTIRVKRQHMGILQGYRNKRTRNI